ncbi:hypothetical protein WA026_010851 [Henosepilachna vigintioctopunctata]|uniref:Cytochrome P450 n=1 Tax=Henosepilachna vigintioctopunctata TaxID=420089 RepID=A0AAW1UWS6_9CUCU
MFRKRYVYWAERNVVQDMAYPLFGINWKSVFGGCSIAEIFQELYNKYSEKRYMGVYDYTTPILVILNPHLLKKISIKDFEYFMNHRPKLPKNVDRMWNRNLFNLVGTEWREMRKTLSPAHTGSRMKGMFVLMEECAKNFVQHFLQQDQDIVELDARETLARYTNDVIATSAYGYQCDSLKDENNEFYIRGLQTTDMSGLWKFIKFDMLRAFPWLGKIIKVELFDGDVTNFFGKIIEENVLYRIENKIERPDLIDLLMHADKSTSNGETVVSSMKENKEQNNGHQKKNLRFNIEDITAQALIFFFSGFGTVSSVLSFLTYELAVNPDIQKRLYEEVSQFRSKNDKLTYEGLGSLTYLDMVLSETLRKWPSFIRTDRVCSRSYTIEPETPDETAVHINKGDIIWIPIFAIHHDEKYWPNPEKFDPDRFSAENKMKIVPGTYIPFGIGPRTCIATRFVIQEIKILLYEIISTFEIVVTEKTLIPCQPYKKSSALLPGEGFWFGLQRRNS